MVLDGIAGETRRGGEERRPRVPTTGAEALRHADMEVGLESVPPVGEPVDPRAATVLGVALAQEAEGILVEAEPQMQAVLFDALAR